MRTVVDIAGGSGAYTVDGAVVSPEINQITSHHSEANVVPIPGAKYLAYVNRDEVTAWPMKGDTVNFGGTDYVSKINYNVWTPTDYPSGWRSTVAPADGAWAPDIRVTAGNVYSYGGKDWSALQGHTTQLGWEPGKVASLFVLSVLVVAGAPWAFPVVYAIGDVVTYLGKTYTCRQSHTSQAAWTPAAVLSLWLPS